MGINVTHISIKKRVNDFDNIVIWPSVIVDATKQQINIIPMSNIIFINALRSTFMPNF